MRTRPSRSTRLVGPVGSGPHGRVVIGDIRSKLEEIRGETQQTAEQARPYAAMGGIAVVIVLLVIAFALGRSRGRHKATWVEIRRL